MVMGIHLRFFLQARRAVTARLLECKNSRKVTNPIDFLCSAPIDERLDAAYIVAVVEGWVQDGLHDFIRGGLDYHC